MMHRFTVIVDDTYDGFKVTVSRDDAGWHAVEFFDAKSDPLNSILSVVRDYIVSMPDE